MISIAKSASHALETCPEKSTVCQKKSKSRKIDGSEKSTWPSKKGDRRQGQARRQHRQKNRRTRHARGHHRALSQLERVTHVVVVGEFSPHEGSDSNDATTILALGGTWGSSPMSVCFVTHVGGYANMRSKIEMGALSSVRRVRRATSAAGSDHGRRRKPG